MCSIANTAMYLCGVMLVNPIIIKKLSTNFTYIVQAEMRVGTSSTQVELQLSYN